MAYSAPLSERIRVQFEILCENTADCISNISQNYKRHVLILSGIAFLLTMRASRRGIRTAKMGGIMGGSSYGSYGKKKGLLARLTGKGGSSSSSYGGYGSATGYGSSSTSSLYGGAGGSTYGAAGLRGTSTMGGGAGGYSSSLGGTTGYGSTLGGAGASTAGGFGGAATNSMSTGAGGFGGASSFSSMAGGGKSTASLADSNPTAIVTLDPSIHFYDYGGSPSFSGQIETVQAYDAPNFVSQVLNQPGQNKVLIIDGGGVRPDMGAVFDADMANTALRNGWKGVIVHGVVRNVAQLSRTQIGVKALGTNPKKGQGAMGQKSVPVSVGSSQLQPGWWVYADGDGVIISQTDISGGSFGGVGGFGSTTSMAGGFGATNTMGGGMNTGGFGSTAGSTMGGASSFTGGYGSTAGGGMAGAGGGLTGGYGNTASSTTLGGGYGSTAAGGLTGGYGSTAGGVGGAARTTLGGGYGATGSLTGGYGSSASNPGYRPTGSYSSGYGGGRSSYSYASSRRKKNKIFKMMLASSIAAIVWLVCLK